MPQLQICRIQIADFLMEFTKVYNILGTGCIKHKLHLVIIFLLTAALMSCSLFEEKPVCPPVGLMDQAHRTTYYRSPDGHDLTDVAHEVVIENFTYECEYDFDGDESSVEIFLNILISARRGPAAIGNAVNIPYFVAIFDADKNILSKDIVTAGIRFPKTDNRSKTIEELAIVIPFKVTQDIYKFKTYIGLQLTLGQFEDYKFDRDQ